MGSTHLEPHNLTGLAAVSAIARFFVDPVRTAVELNRSLGRFVVIKPPLKLMKNAPRQAVMVVGEALNREILGKPDVWRTVNITAGGKRGHVSRELGKGLVQMNGPRQTYYRKLLSPPLRRKNIDDRGPQITSIARDDIRTWPVGESFDLWTHSRQLMQHFAIDLMFGADRALGCPLAEQIEKGLSQSFSVLTAIPADIPGTPYHSFLRGSETCAANIVAWAKTKAGSDDPDDLLALLVNNPGPDGQPASDQVFINQVPTLFGAAYETCQNSIFWTLLVLAIFPDIQRRLIAEIRDVMKEDAIEYARINDLPFLDSVVRESFRMFPPVPFQYRVATRDTELGTVALQRGARAVLSPYLTNRDPKVFDRPNSFSPDRWSRIRANAYAYSTFSAGPRVCPGTWFASAVIKSAIATLLQRNAIVVADGTRVNYRVHVMMSPRDTVHAMLSDEPARERPAIAGNFGYLFD